MIRTLTIVEHTTDNGIVGYTLNGDLPVDEAARGLIIAVFNAKKPGQVSVPVAEIPVA